MPINLAALSAPLTTLAANEPTLGLRLNLQAAATAARRGDKALFTRMALAYTRMSARLEGAGYEALANPGKPLPLTAARRYVASGLGEAMLALVTGDAGEALAMLTLAATETPDAYPA